MKLASTQAASMGTVTRRSSVSQASGQTNQPQDTYSKSHPSEVTSFVSDYFHKVGAHIKEDGVMGTMMDAGINGMLGGISGEICGSLLSSYVPGPIGHAFSTIGAVGGFFYGLQK